MMFISTQLSRQFITCIIAISFVFLFSYCYNFIIRPSYEYKAVDLPKMANYSSKKIDSLDLVYSAERKESNHGQTIEIVDPVSNNYTTDLKLKTSRVSKDDMKTLESIHNLIWKQIEKMQEDGDCETKKILICQNGQYAGFGSMLHAYGACMQMAFGLNRLWFIDQPQYNHFNGFEQFLKPESSKCGYLKEKYRNSPLICDIEDPKYYHGYELDNSCKIFKYYSKGHFPHPLHVPTTLPLEIEKELERHNVAKPWLWFTSQFLGYLLLRPKEAFQRKINSFNIDKQLENQYAAMHVRRGDKLIREAKAVAEEKYVEKIIDYFHQINQHLRRQVYIASDNKNMLNIIKGNLQKLDNKDYVLYKNPSPDTSASYFSNKFPKELMENFLFDIYLVTNANFSVVTFSSNMGRLVNELKQCKPPYKTDIGKTIITMDSPWESNYGWYGLSDTAIDRFYVTIEINKETKFINGHNLLQYDKYERFEHEKDAKQVVLDNGKTVVLTRNSRKRVEGYIYKDHFVKWPGRPNYLSFS